MAAFFERAFHGKYGVVYDRERIFNLVRDFCGNASGGAELAFAHGRFVSFLEGTPLFFEQKLQAVATRSQQPQKN